MSFCAAEPPQLGENVCVAIFHIVRHTESFGSLAVNELIYGRIDNVHCLI